MSALIDDELLRPSGWYDEQDRLTATFRNAPETIAAHEAGRAVAYLLHRLSFRYATIRPRTTGTSGQVALHRPRKVDALVRATIAAAGPTAAVEQLTELVMEPHWSLVDRLARAAQHRHVPPGACAPPRARLDCGRTCPQPLTHCQRPRKGPTAMTENAAPP